MASLYDDEGCQCTNPKNEAECYEPVCPEGTYKCCYNCEVSLCAEGDTKVNKLILSKRGIYECLECRSGDFCPGCDQMVECPLESGAVSVGAAPASGKSPKPKISLPGSVEERECKYCPQDYEASVERDRCENPWRDSCDVHRMEVCVAGCRDYQNECDRMACKVYCANQQGEVCLATLQEDCETLNTPYVPPEDINRDDTEAGTASEDEDEELLILSDDDGKADYEPPRSDKPCKLRCNTAFGSCSPQSLAVLFSAFVSLVIFR